MGLKVVRCCYEPYGAMTAYFLNCMRHREDGPAIICDDGSYGWWINDRDITQEVEQWMRIKEITWPWDEATQVEFQLTWT